MGLLDHQPLIHAISLVLKGSLGEALSLWSCLYNIARPGPWQGTCSGDPGFLPSFPGSLRNQVSIEHLLQSTHRVHIDVLKSNTKLESRDGK